MASIECRDRILAHCRILGLNSLFTRCFPIGSGSSWRRDTFICTKRGMQSSCNCALWPSRASQPSVRPPRTHCWAQQSHNPFVFIVFFTIFSNLLAGSPVSWLFFPFQTVRINFLIVFCATVTQSVCFYCFYCFSNLLAGSPVSWLFFPFQSLPMYHYYYRYYY